MGKPRESWSKQDKEKQNLKKKKEKEERKIERKANKGNGLDDMIAYVDENGQLTSTPPDPSRKVEINIEEIEISVRKQEPGEPADLIKKGTVTFFNDSKGYGFIKDSETQQSVFVHVNGLVEGIKENDKVTYEVEMGHKGPTAVNVKLLK